MLQTNSTTDKDHDSLGGLKNYFSSENFSPKAIIRGLNSAATSVFCDGVSWLLEQEEFKQKPHNEQLVILNQALHDSPLDQYENVLNQVVKSEVYKGWDEEDRAQFIWSISMDLPLTKDRSTKTHVIMSQDSVLVLSPEKGVNPDWQTGFEFNAERGIGMVGGICTTSFNDEALGAEQLVDRYDPEKRAALGLSPRPDQTLRLAFMTQKIMNNANMLGIPAALSQRMRDDFDILAPNGIPDDLRAQFEEEMPMEFEGIDL